MVVAHNSYRVHLKASVCRFGTIQSAPEPEIFRARKR